MQILLDSRSDNFNNSNDHLRGNISESDLVKKMSLEEIKRNLVLFVLAGYDSTSSTLNDCIYMLLSHPTEMLKVQKEIDHAFATGSEVKNLFIIRIIQLSDYCIFDIIFKKLLSQILRALTS